MADRFELFLKEWRDQMPHVNLDESDARKLFEIIERVVSEEYAKELVEAGYPENILRRQVR